MEYKHHHVGLRYPVYCTDRDARAIRMLFFADRYNSMEYFRRVAWLYSPYKEPLPPRNQYARDPAELRWMADIAARDDVWGS